jgi:hypothetical protein
VAALAAWLLPVFGLVVLVVSWLLGTPVWGWAP